MDDFKVRFAQYHPDSDTYTFSNARTGVIVALVRSTFHFLEGIDPLCIFAVNSK